MSAIVLLSYVAGPGLLALADKPAFDAGASPFRSQSSLTAQHSYCVRFRLILCEIWFSKFQFYSLQLHVP